MASDYRIRIGTAALTHFPVHERRVVALCLEKLKEYEFERRRARLH